MHTTLLLRYRTDQYRTVSSGGSGRSIDAAGKVIEMSEKRTLWNSKHQSPDYTNKMFYTLRIREMLKAEEPFDFLDHYMAPYGKYIGRECLPPPHKPITWRWVPPSLKMLYEAPTNKTNRRTQATIPAKSITTWQDWITLQPDNLYAR